MTCPSQDALISIAKARELLPVSRSHLARLLRAGEVRGLLVKSPGSRRGRWLISRESLAEYIAKGLREHEPAPLTGLGVERLDALAERARR